MNLALCLDGRADLHLHTCHSDGSYTPAQIVDLARRAGLAAIAITDHDTCAGYAPARQAAAQALEVVPALELTAYHQERAFHLLGYFVRPHDSALLAAQQHIRQRRQERLDLMVTRLRGCGVHLEEAQVQPLLRQTSPGRRHLAELLVQTGHVATVREAFSRYLADRGSINQPDVGLPLAEAIAVVRGAGGVAIWAHPSYDGTRRQVSELQRLGLQGIEVEYPGFRPTQVRQLRAVAAEFGLLTSGGSDCHGPGVYQQEVGARSCTLLELEKIRMAAR